MSNAPVEPGQVLAGKYRVERVLGEGGFGVVVSAMHTTLDQRVALKFLLPSALSNAETIERFVREARASCKLKGEHVAKVSDVGTLETGAPYMVMEYLSGQDLGSLLSVRGRLPVHEAVDYVLQAMEAVAEAHTNDIVHRDLKPANLFVTTRPDGTPLVKVLDFGISKVGGTFEGGLTKTTAVMGSPFYMSPEQMRSSRNVDGRSDLWSLGIILFELVTGRVAFEGETLPELCANVLTSPTPDVREYRDDLPQGLAEVIDKCLQKDPQKRFATVADLALALAPYATDDSRIHVERICRLLGVAAEGVRTSQVAMPAPAVSVAKPAPPQGFAQTDASWGSEPSPTKRKKSGPPVAILAVGALAAVALGVGAFFALSSSKPAGAGPSPSASRETPVADPAAVTSSAPAPVVAPVPPPPTTSAAAAPASATATSTSKTKGPAGPPAKGPPPVKKSSTDPFGDSRH